MNDQEKKVLMDLAKCAAKTGILVIEDEGDEIHVQGMFVVKDNGTE